MATIYEDLCRHPFFAHFPPTTLKRIAEYATLQSFDPGDFIMLEGGDADNFYLIESGEVSLKLYVPKHGRVIVDQLYSGDILGWSWLIPPHHWQFDATAGPTTVRTISINGKALRTLVNTDHELGYQLMKRIPPIVVNRLQATRKRLVDLLNTVPDGDFARENWEKLLP